MSQALNLWNKQFGRKNKTCDFAGRQMEKSAFEKKSQYAWTILEIENQKFCCHVLTAKEKGDDFPFFMANEKQFMIQKNNNRYEIVETFEEVTPTFLDGAYGMKFWNETKSKPDYDAFYYVKVHIQMSKHYEGFISRFQQFMEELFQTPCLVHEKENTICFTCLDYHADDDQTLLDRCVILNTYAQHFFERQYNCKIHIACGKSKTVQAIQELQVPFEHTLSIDSHIKFHTSAKDEMETLTTHMDGMYPYNYTYTNLRKHLESK